MKAFYVIMIITNMHGHTHRDERAVGWMTEHQCHLKARWIEEQHPHTIASCQSARRH